MVELFVSAFQPLPLPFMDPIVQLKEQLEVVAVRLIFTLSPLQIVLEELFVKVGAGLTVTVILAAEPVQLDKDVGVTV